MGEALFLGNRARSGMGNDLVANRVIGSLGDDFAGEQIALGPIRPSGNDFSGVDISHTRELHKVFCLRC